MSSRALIRELDRRAALRGPQENGASRGATHAMLGTPRGRAVICVRLMSSTVAPLKFMGRQLRPCPPRRPLCGGEPERQYNPSVISSVVTMDLHRGLGDLAAGALASLCELRTRPPSVQRGNGARREISHLEGDFASKPFCAPSETRFTL
jgi:hypothetical protein